MYPATQWRLELSAAPLQEAQIPYTELLLQVFISLSDSKKKVKVFRYKPDVAVGVPGD
jgi:hypothetical protein